MNNVIWATAVLALATFAVGCNRGPYQKTGNRVRYVTGAGARELDVDSKSFQILENYYAKDKEHVWCKGYLLVGADPATFQILGDHREHDAAGYAKDKHHVWYEIQQLPDAESASFDLMASTNHWQRGRDSKRVYIREHLVIGANPATYTVLWDLYGTDDKHVFSGSIPLPEADPATFEFLGDRGDFPSVIDRSVLTNGGDPAHAALAFPANGKYVVSWRYSRDKLNAYFGPDRIASADLKSFRIDDEGNGLAHDKNSRFIGCYTEVVHRMLENNAGKPLRAMR